MTSSRSRSTGSLFFVSRSYDCFKESEFLGHCWMDAHRVIKIFFGNSFEQGNCESLGYLACVRSKVMESDHFIAIGLIYYDLCIAVLAFFFKIPLQRFIDTSISYDVVRAKHFSCFLFGISACSIFDGSENCSRNEFIAHVPLSIVKQSIS